MLDRLRDLSLPTLDQLRQTLPGAARRAERGYRIRLPDVVRGAVRSVPRVPGMAIAGAIAVRSDKGISESIGSYLERNAERYGAAPAVRFEDQVLSHAELDRRVNRVARALAEAGVASGAVVAVGLENRPEILVVVAALAKLGAVPAMLNTNQHGRVLAHSVTVAGSTWAILGAEMWEAFAEVRDEVGLSDPERVWWIADQPNACGGERHFAELPAGVPAAVRDLGAESYDRDGSPPPWTAAVRLGDPCFYIFTSGTTGLPKASVMTHMRWVKAGFAFGRAMLDLGPGDTVYTPLPLYHNQALTVAWASAAANGAAIASRRRFSTSQFFEDCRKHHAKAIVYIGEVPRYLLNAPPSDRDRDHGVRAAVGNGLRPDVWRRFQERFGIEHIFEIYAASEANTIFVNALNLERTVGVCPTPHAIVRYDVENGRPIRDAKGFMVRAKTGEAGLLLGKVSARFDFDGYTDPAASEKKLVRDVFEKGDVWYDSGDLLRKIGWGHAEFVDRVGDTFRWKSENVSTGEVEHTINQHPQVLESTVYGVEIPGNEGRAGMVTINTEVHPDAFDVDDLLERCRADLPPYAIPLFVRVRSELQTTGTFKHQKTRLREEAWNTDDPVWALWPGRDRYVRLDAETAEQVPAQRW